MIKSTAIESLSDNRALLAKEEEQPFFLDDSNPLKKEKIDREKAMDFEGKASDLELKRKYAKGLMCLMWMQLTVMNVVFFLVGFGWMSYSDYALQLYVSGTLLEVCGLILVVTRYLFRHQQ